MPLLTIIAGLILFILAPHLVIGIIVAPIAVFLLVLIAVSIISYVWEERLTVLLIVIVAAFAWVASGFSTNISALAPIARNLSSEGKEIASGGRRLIYTHLGLDVLVPMAATARFTMGEVVYDAKYFGILPPGYAAPEFKVTPPPEAAAATDPVSAPNG